MNRRGFLKSLGAAAIAPFVLPKAEAKPEQMSGRAIMLKRQLSLFGSHSTIFNNREICDFGQTVMWSEPISDHNRLIRWNKDDCFELPTNDVCVCLGQIEGELYWIGAREVWRIRYTENPQCLFYAERTSWSELYYDEKVVVHSVPDLPYRFVNTENQKVVIQPQKRL